MLDAINLESCAVIADGEEGSEKRLVAFVVRKPSIKSTNTLPMNEDGNQSCLLLKFTDHRRLQRNKGQQKTRLAHYMVPSVYIERLPPIA